MLVVLLLIPIVLAAQSEVKINDYVVSIDDNTLKSIQPSDASRSDELNLSNLGLRSIDKNAFDHVEHVTNLSLANNSLSALPEFVFANLKNLEYLSLADNNIEGFVNNFVGLNNLRILNISNNRLFDLEKYSFFGLTKSSDILTLGIPFGFLDTDLFENPLLRNETFRHEFEEEAKADEDDITEPSYEGQDIPENDPWILQNSHIRAKICIQEGTVKLFDILKENETLASDCKKVRITETGEIYLMSLGISSFARGWYRLQGLPVYMIILRSNSIVRITSELLNDLPKEITHVVLFHNKIERLEKGIIQNEHLKELWLNGNFINEIEDGALENTKLKSLWLMRNRLKNTKFAATLPSTLTSLFLGDNRISELNNDSFVNLNQLEWLVLSGNNLTHVKTKSLRGLSSLRKLTFAFNRLHKIEPAAFQDLKALRTLDLSYNKFERFDKGVFMGLQNIRLIDVGDNKFTKLTKDSFEDLPESLGEIYLGSNAIETVENGTFVNVPKRKLSLRSNKISKIEKGSFDLPELRELDLRENLLEEINDGSFEGLGDLQVLWLDKNRIAKIEYGAMKNLVNLYRLYLSDNPIKKLENGAFFGLPKSGGSYVTLHAVPVELIQGGLFDEV